MDGKPSQIPSQCPQPHVSFTQGSDPASVSTSSRSVLPRTVATAAAGGGPVGLRMGATAHVPWWQVRE